MLQASRPFFLSSYVEHRAILSLDEAETTLEQTTRISS